VWTVVADPAQTERPIRPRAEFIVDDDHPGGVMVVMDSVRQSYVDLDDPTYLDFEYIQFFASVLQTLPEGVLAVTHIGGGGLTVPRFLNTVRPGSSQIVFEPNVELTEQVRRRLPLPRHHNIRIRAQDGRAGIASLAPASADVVVLDAYSDGRVPADLSTEAFFGEVRRVLRPNGMFLGNFVDEPGLAYLGRVTAGALRQLPHLVLVSSTDVLKGRRFGNLVLAGSTHAFDVKDIRREVVRQPFPAGVLDTRELRRRFGGCRPWQDDDGQNSPEPTRDGWRIR